MYAADFIYDGVRLSGLGTDDSGEPKYTIADFGGSNGEETQTMGSEITFNTVSLNSGKSYSLTGSSYDTCLSATFQICKNSCHGQDSEQEFTADELRTFMRWLNRREFCRFAFYEDSGSESYDCYFMASFTVSKLTVGGKVYGLELDMTTNAPFGFMDVEKTYRSLPAGTEWGIYELSDEIGDIYPVITVISASGGTLTIKNTDPTGATQTMVVNNYIPQETLTFDCKNKIITSDSAEHSTLADDFNYEFICLRNTFDSSNDFTVDQSTSNRLNTITSSLACEMTIAYSKIVKGFR